MTRCRDMDKKMPQKWGFTPICDPQRFFFRNRALSLLYTYGALTSCKKQSPRHKKTNRPQTTNGQGWLLRTGRLWKLEEFKCCLKAILESYLSFDFGYETKVITSFNFYQKHLQCIHHWGVPDNNLIWYSNAVP